MERYKAKPVYVDAVQITDEMIDATPPSPLHVKGIRYDPINRTVHIHSGGIGVVGYWIVRGEDGWLTLWGDALFNGLYEKVGGPILAHEYTEREKN